MSLPAVTRLPQTDHLRIQALIRSLASGMIVPIELGERAYRLGNESCHRAMDDLTESLPEEPLELSVVERIGEWRNPSSTRISPTRFIGTPSGRQYLAFGAPSAVHTGQASWFDTIDQVLSWATQVESKLSVLCGLGNRKLFGCNPAERGDTRNFK